MTLSYKEAQMILEMCMIGIENGNSATPKPFDPTPEQYNMLCEIANRAESDISRMQKDYGLE